MIQLLTICSVILIVTCLRLMNHMGGFTTRRLAIAVWLLLASVIGALCLAYYDFLTWPIMLLLSIQYMAISLWLLCDRREVNNPPPIRDLSQVHETVNS